MYPLSDSANSVLDVLPEDRRKDALIAYGTIVSEIKDAFDVEITVDDLIPQNFNSAEAMLALIEARQN